MGIRKIDKNFDTAVVAPEGLEWFSLRSLPFTVCGVSLFANGKFTDTVMPSYEQIASADPDYLGFFRMAERVYPVLNALLNGEK